MATLTRLIEQLRIRARAELGAPQNDEFRDATGWTVRLERSSPRRRLTVPFYMGAALDHEPSAAEVLKCLQSDAASYLNADRGFEEWARDFGMDPDSRRAEAIFQACARMTEKLRRFFGSEFGAFMRAGSES